MKIIFVGICNKPGLKPLDPSTFTGKIIEKIIDACDDYGMEVIDDIVLSNFYDTDHMPDADRFDTLRWATRVGYCGNDVVVRLGKQIVRRMHSAPIMSIDIDHPASLVRKSEDARDEYICNAAHLIKGMVLDISAETVS